LTKKNISIGIDATSIVDGGGFTHLSQFLFNYLKIKHYSTHKLNIYASLKVLNQLPNHPNFIKRNFPLLNKSRFHRVFFQLFLFDKFLNKECDILFSVTGDYTGVFRPYVAMSQNMMLYEREFWDEIKSIKEKAKFFFNFRRQQKCFKNAEGIIFLSQYAKKYITKVLKIEDKNKAIIHHGISNQFISKKIEIICLNNYSEKSPFRFLYVSTVHVYKNQWHVVEAISKLKEKGYPVSLTLIGDIIYKPSGDKLKRTIDKADPKREFINHILHIPNTEMADQYFNHDGIIFASSCENMPNILLESMGSGKPIASSDKSPMPEFLKEGGFYFNASSVNSIFNTLENMLLSLKTSQDYSIKNIKELKNYTWEKTATKTIDFIENTLKRYKNG
tara:strand:+ start:34474 stop:35640 length:1167 start_codon:yes stop_codon:yes gene_type:complete